MQAHPYIWLNGRFHKYQDVKVHVFTQTIQYGTGIFEGLRSYPTSNGKVGIFRLDDHVKRFFESAKIYLFDLPFTQEQIRKGIIDTAKKNKIGHAYIRPFGFYDHEGISLDLLGKKMNVSITTMPFGNYFAGKDKGITCMVSAWRKINSSILPPQAKVSGNYIASILSEREAKQAGYDEAILLDQNGHVGEGASANIFIVKDNALLTPSKGSEMLWGMTRDSAIKIARSSGIEVVEREVHREELYTADEIFFTGTAAEITPVVNVDSRTVKNGKVGPITKALSDRFAKVASGQDKEFARWITII